MPKPLLSIENLTRTFDQGSGIFNVSLDIFPNDFIILAGRNGSGKTTLIRHFNGLLKADTGQVRFNGQDIFDDLILARKKIGMVFQDPDTQIIGDTVFDETAFGLENLKTAPDRIQAKVTQALDRLGLLHLKDRNPSTLSGGEKRRLAIAGILVMEPDLIVFDEPFANLDYPATLALSELCRDLNRAGHAIVMATHDVDPVMTMATRTIIMGKGQIVADGQTGSLVDQLESWGIKNPFKPMALECRP